MRDLIAEALMIANPFIELTFLHLLTLSRDPAFSPVHHFVKLSLRPIVI
jgi:hypothetical protein